MWVYLLSQIGLPLPVCSSALLQTTGITHPIIEWYDSVPNETYWRAYDQLHNFVTVTAGPIEGEFEPKTAGFNRSLIVYLFFGVIGVLFLVFSILDFLQQLDKYRKENLSAKVNEAQHMEQGTAEQSAEKSTAKPITNISVTTCDQTDAVISETRTNINTAPKSAKQRTTIITTTRATIPEMLNIAGASSESDGFDLQSVADQDS